MRNTIQGRAEVLITFVFKALPACLLVCCRRAFAWLTVLPVLAPPSAGPAAQAGGRAAHSNMVLPTVDPKMADVVLQQQQWAAPDRAVKLMTCSNPLCTNLQVSGEWGVL